MVLLLIIKKKLKVVLFHLIPSTSQQNKDIKQEVKKSLSSYKRNKFHTLIQCMFSEYSGSLNGRNAYDKGFLIAIQAKRYKVFFSTSMSYLLMNVTTRTVIRCYFVLFMLTIWTSSMSNTIIRGEKYQNSKFIRYLCFKSEEKELNTSRCNLRRQERS